MNRRSTTDWYDPQQGMQAIRLRELECSEGWEPPRTNYFSVVWLASGTGDFWADAGRYSFAGRNLLFFTPYQYIRIEPAELANGCLIHFHANFLCVETFHAESGCAGALFNNPFQSPAVALDQPAAREVAAIIKRMQHEQQTMPLGFADMLLAQLKTLLILATRRKVQTAAACANGAQPRHPVLGPLKELLDQNFTTLHSPADYAKRLHMTPKTLGRVVREQLGKSLTDLIRERILTHAKWQLLHTLKPVKEVAREVGFADELYFSRMFKKATGTSPTFFRDFETKIRGGSNLSMLSHPAPIRGKRRSSDTSDS